MAKRQGLSKKTRFEVFKRDSFTCQYCGAKAPDAVLHVDHVKPVAEGGDNSIVNLVTACVGCNAGKGRRELSDGSAVAVQHAQLSALQERRQQIEMMAEWRRELASLDDTAAVMAEEAWTRHVRGAAFLTGSGKNDLRTWVKKHGLEAVFNGMAGAIGSYLQADEAGKPTLESINHAFSMVPRVIAVQKRSADKPYLPRLFYARGILRNRLHYVNERTVMLLLEEAVVLGADVEGLVAVCREVKNWTEFENTIQGLRDFMANAASSEEGE